MNRLNAMEMLLAELHWANVGQYYPNSHRFGDFGAGLVEELNPAAPVFEMKPDTVSKKEAEPDFCQEHVTRSKECENDPQVVTVDFEEAKEASGIATSRSASAVSGDCKQERNDIASLLSATTRRSFKL